MEKGTPHCKLAVVRRLAGQGKVRMTKTALVGGAALGFDALAIVEVVKTLAPADFYKSMTTQDDHTVWQDVLIVSFKEL
jgi:motility quorum-sensing regulator/GCU-specific mRNA interferase toxin